MPTTLGKLSSWAVSILPSALLRSYRTKPKSAMAFLFYLASVGASMLFAAALLRWKYPWIGYEIHNIKTLAGAMINVVRNEKKRMFMVDLFEKAAKENPEKPFVIFQDNIYTYEFMDRKMNKVANVATELGLKQGDVVAVLMQNEPAFIWTFYGLGKVGVQPAFLNFNLRSKSLLHCFAVSGAKILIVGQSDNDELILAVEEIYDDLQKLGVKVFVQGHISEGHIPKKFESFEDLLERAPDTAVDISRRKGLVPKTPFCYIYTSGTTGLPKAAVVSHSKALKGAIIMHTLGVTGDDVIYTPLPLYHSAAALIALGTTVLKGATLVLRKKFSASQYWDDCRKHDVTVVQYIGELCRYLVARPRSPDDGNHKVRIACGNGLRRDIWREFVDRFQVPIIGEFYAATEGNAGFINLWSKVGSVGRISPILGPTYIVKYDIEKDEPIRDSNGKCVLVGPDEPGLFIVQIKRNFDFDGYKGKKELSDKKVLRNVFKKGDAFFNSGDLLSYDKEYFVYFVDRIGDTFRWKGENVATIEVSNVVADTEWIEDANVYGVTVPGQDGRAGMAAITLAKNSEVTPSNLSALYHHCEELLPSYARPWFLRIQKELAVTSTLKQRKVELVKEGFDPDLVKGDPLYIMDPAKKSYAPLDKDMYERVVTGKVRL